VVPRLFITRNCVRTQEVLVQTMEDLYASTQESLIKSPRHVKISSESQSPIAGAVATGVNNVMKDPGKKGNAAVALLASPRGKQADAAAAPKPLQRAMNGTAAESASRQVHQLQPLQPQQSGAAKRGIKATAAAALVVSPPPPPSLTAQQQLEQKLAQETRDAREVER
jgi:hypothetical protein